MDKFAIIPGSESWSSSRIYSMRGGKAMRLQVTVLLPLNRRIESRSTSKSLLTYDVGTREYRHWYFDSGGSIPRGIAHGKWDEKSQTMNWISTDEDGNKMVGKTKIIDRDTHEWTVVVTDPNGKLMLDLRAKNTRRK